MTTDDATNVILLNAKLKFSNMPRGIQSLEKVLECNKDALSEFLDIGVIPIKSELISTDLGNHVAHSCVRHLIQNHIAGKTWNGDFKLEDWDVINGCEIVLSKAPKMDFEIDTGAKDLYEVDLQLLPLYQKDDKNGKKVSPLYFQELDTDLSVLAANLTEADLDWYREYILSHPAFMPPMARIDLIRGLYREIKTHNLSDSPQLRQILTDPHECCYADWRILIYTSNCDALVDVFWHPIPKEERKTAPPKYDESLGSCLDLERNSCQHLEERTRDNWGRQMMKKSIEAEVFTVKKVEKCFTDLIKKLLQKCKMEEPLNDVWQVYKSAGLNYKFTIQKGKK